MKKRILAGLAGVLLGAAVPGADAAEPAAAQPAAGLSGAEVSVRVDGNRLLLLDSEGKTLLALDGLATHGAKRLPFAAIERVTPRDALSADIVYTPAKAAADRGVKALSATVRLLPRGVKLVYRAEVDPGRAKAAPGNVVQSLTLGEGVTREAVGRVEFAALFDDAIPTRHDARDLFIRPFRRDGKRVLALPLTGNDRWGTDTSEHLRFTPMPDGSHRGELSYLVPRPAQDPEEPMRYANRYSVELDDRLMPGPGFFPTGVLADKLDIGFGPYIGGNYEVKTATPDDAPEMSRIGVYGISVWAALRTKNAKGVKRAEDENGKATDVCLFDPASVEMVFDYARKAVARALERDTGAIFKWEIDNEYIPGLDYSAPAVAAFHAWLADRYRGDLARLNRAWKTELAAFTDAVPPKLAEHADKPAAFLDWSRFQQETFAEFLGNYYRVIHEADPLRRGVNGKDTQSSLEMQRIARTKRANHELIGKAVAPYALGVRGMDHYGHGDRNAYEINYYYNTIAPADVRPGKRIGMLYGENNNHNGPGWQFAQTVWRMIPNGLRGGHFFCSGWFGCWGDWSSFGFTLPDGGRRDKFFYLPRFYAAIHRAERFFTQSAVPAEAKRVAILFAQRDMPFGVDDNITPWGFPINSRLRLYAHLRNAGYWVDVITYDKLKPEYMDKVGALFLVSAEHMTEAELENVRSYVRRGGILFADTRAGYYDEHHLPHAVGLSDVLGLNYKGVFVADNPVVDPGDVWFGTPRGNLVRADGRVHFARTTAEIANDRHAFYTSNKAAVLAHNRFGQGTAYWINTQLGTIRSESAVGEGPARDWFRARLADAGLKPSYTLIPDLTERFRLESPLWDEKGNAYLAVAGLTGETLPPTKLRVALPAACSFRHAFIGLAEDYALRPLPFRRLENGEVEFDLPELVSAAGIYLFQDHAPLVGLKVEGVSRQAAADPSTALVRPGERFHVVAQVANPNARLYPAGMLKVNGLSDWTVSPAVATRPLAPGELAEYRFEVTLPAESRHFVPNFVYPLVAELSAGDRRVALCHGVVAVEVDTAGRELLLSDNWSAENYPWALWTGSDYRYLTEAGEGAELKDDFSLQSYGDGMPIGALRSGDRSDRRRYADYKNLPEVEVVFDLKNAYDLTRLLVRRRNAATSPTGLSVSVSADDKDYAGEVAVEPDWLGEYAHVPLPEARRGRYVKVKFTFPPGTNGSVDDVWLFGKTIPGQPAGKRWNETAP